MDLLELARQEDINIVALPPHTTHMLQPLDRVVFGPFKKAYKKYCTEFLAEKPENVISKVTWPKILSSVWDEVMRPDLLQKAFEATGIHPVNPSRIPADAFLPSETLRAAVGLTNDEDQVAQEDEDQEMMPTFPEVNWNQELTGHEFEVQDVVPASDIAPVGDFAPTSDIGPASDIAPAGDDGGVVISLTEDEIHSLNGLILEINGQPMQVNLDNGDDAIESLPVVPLPSTSTSTPISMDEQIEEELGIPALGGTPKTKASKSNRRITTHRILTSDEIIRSKNDAKEAKEKKEEEKRIRKEKAEQRKMMKELSKKK